MTGSPPHITYMGNDDPKGLAEETLTLELTPNRSTPWTSEANDLAPERGLLWVCHESKCPHLAHWHGMPYL